MTTPQAQPILPPLLSRHSRRSLIVAVEGVDGAGKTTLCRALTQHFGADALYCKRPSPGSDAARLLAEALSSGDPARMHDPRILEAMDRDCADILATARQWTSIPGRVAILDRHWLSACVYQGSRASVAKQRALHGEPDLWVIVDGDTDEIWERLQERGGDAAAPSKDAIRRLRCRYHAATPKLDAPRLHTAKPLAKSANIIQAITAMMERP